MNVVDVGHLRLCGRGLRSRGQGWSGLRLGAGSGLFCGFGAHQILKRLLDDGCAAFGAGLREVVKDKAGTGKDGEPGECEGGELECFGDAFDPAEVELAVAHETAHPWRLAAQGSSQIEGEGSPELLLLVVFPGIELDGAAMGRDHLETVPELQHERRLAAAPGAFNGAGKWGAGVGRGEKIGQRVDVELESQFVDGCGAVADGTGLGEDRGDCGRRRRVVCIRVGRGRSSRVGVEPDIHTGGNADGLIGEISAHAGLL